MIKLANEFDAEKTIQAGSSSFPVWDQKGVVARANIVRKMVNLLEEHQAELMALVVREGRKTLQNTLSEVREAIDFFVIILSRLNSYMIHCAWLHCGKRCVTNEWSRFYIVY